MEEQLVQDLRRVRQAHRRRRRTAMTVYLLAGLAFGSCIYLARTRMASFVAEHRWPFFLLLVGAAAGLFWLATRLEEDARREAERAREIEERLDRLRRR